MGARIRGALTIMFLFFALAYVLHVRSQENIGFFVYDVWWGTHESRTTAEPGDKNVPLTILVRQNTSYYLRGVRGYLHLNATEGVFRDSVDGDFLADADAVPIETEDNDYDVIPYGSFYFTFLLDIDENATKGEYTVVLEIANYTMINKSSGIFYPGPTRTYTVKLTIDNRPPEVKEKDPEEGTVTIYVGENETFSVKAKDPDGDSITYTWYLDDEAVGKKNATEYTYIANNSDKGTHTLEVRISDGDKETVISWTISVPNRAPEIKDYNPPEDTVSIFVGDNRTFSVVAEDPDGDNITYTWYVDNDDVLEGSNATNYTYIANDSDVGTHTIIVEVSDGEDASRVTWTVNVEITSKTRIVPSAEYILAGRKTNISIIIGNNIWQGTVEVDVSYPDYVAVFTDTHWTFRDVQPGDNITIEMSLYVPAKVLTTFGEVELIGQTLDFTIDLSFSDKYGRSHSESHSAEFIIRGGVVLRYFGMNVNPDNAIPGGEVEVSFTILNVGVATARYANASILKNPYIVLMAESFYYIGDMEPGAPIPIVLKFEVNSTTSPGEYSITILIDYFDDVYNEITERIIMNFTVVIPPPQTITEGDTIHRYMDYIYAGIIIVLATFLYIIMRRVKIRIGE